MICDTDDDNAAAMSFQTASEAIIIEGGGVVQFCDYDKNKFLRITIEQGDITELEMKIKEGEAT